MTHQGCFCSYPFTAVVGLSFLIALLVEFLFTLSSLLSGVWLDGKMILLRICPAVISSKSHRSSTSTPLFMTGKSLCDTFI